MKKAASATVGVCGEHYVAAYLSGYGLAVALPRGGNPGTDLFFASHQGGPAIRMQVKTGTDSYRKDKSIGSFIYLWSTSCKVIDRHDDNLWFAYVWLKGWPKEPNPPEVFFVPSSVVVKCMQDQLNDNGGKPISWSYFWLQAVEAEQYRGQAGLATLLAALGQGEPPTE